MRKRVLAALLAGLMLFDTMSVHATTLGADYRIEQTEDLGESDTILETSIAEQAESLLQVDTSELTECKIQTEIVEMADAIEMTESMVATDEGTILEIQSINVDGNYLFEDRMTKVYGLATQFVVEIGADNRIPEDARPIVKIINKDGSVMETTYIEQHYAYYTRHYFDYTDIGEVTATAIEVSFYGKNYYYEIEVDDVYVALGNDTYKTGTTNLCFKKGEVLQFSSKASGEGVFSYFEFREGADLAKFSWDNMPNAAKAEWESQYAAIYGEYGADNKYYCFRYEGGIWYPQLEGVACGEVALYYNDIVSGFTSIWLNITKSDREVYLWKDNHYYFSDVTNHYIDLSWPYWAGGRCAEFLVYVRKDIGESKAPIVRIESDGGYFTETDDIEVRYMEGSDYIAEDTYAIAIYGEDIADDKLSIITVEYGGEEYKFRLKDVDLYYNTAEGERVYFKGGNGEKARLPIAQPIQLRADIDDVGALWYIDTSEFAGISVEPLSAEAESAWNELYADTYGSYGAENKYYAFTYGENQENTHFPAIKSEDEISGTLIYGYKTPNDEADTGWDRVNYSVAILGDYHLRYKGERLRVEEEGYNTIYVEGKELLFELYCGDVKVQPGQCDIFANSSYLGMGDAVSIVNDETGVGVKILTDKYTGDDGCYTSLAELFGGTFWFEFAVNQSEQKKYKFYNSNVIIVTGKNKSNQSAKFNETVTLDKNEYRVRFYHGLSVQSSADEGFITDVKITSSNPNVVKFPYSGNGTYIEGADYCFPAEALLVGYGSSDITIRYKHYGKECVDTFTINVVSQEEFAFGDITEDYYDVIPFTDGQVIETEVGSEKRFFTNISPDEVTNVKIISSNPKVMSVEGTGFAREYGYIKEVNDLWTSTNYMYATAKSVGTATLTFTGTYKGKTYTQKVTYIVKEQEQVAIKRVRLAEDGTYQVYGDPVTSLDFYCNNDRQFLALVNLADNDKVLKLSDYQMSFFNDTKHIVLDSEENFKVYHVTEDIFYIEPWSNFPFTMGNNGDGIWYDCIPGFLLKNKDGRTVTQVALPCHRMKLDAWPLKNVSIRYDGENTTEFVTEANIIEGERLSIILHNNVYDSYTFENGTLEENGCRIVERKDSNQYMDEADIELVLEFDTSVRDAAKSRCNIVDSSGKLVGTINVNILKPSNKEVEVPVANQYLIKMFLEAEDNSADLYNVRVGCYEVSLITQEDGTKAAIILGLLEEKTELVLPEYLILNTVNRMRESHWYITSEEVGVKVLGCEDGVFDTAKGYYQPSKVSIPAEYIYMGSQLSGWTNPLSGIETTYDKIADENASDDIFVVYPNGVFVLSDGQYIRLESCSADVSGTVTEGVTLFTRGTAGKTKLAFKMAESVKEYRLVRDYLRDLNDAEIPVKIEEQDGEYYVSFDREMAGTNVSQLSSGTYYMKMIPVIQIKLPNSAETQEFVLDAVYCAVSINFDTDVPKVLAQEEVIFNTYFENEAVVPLELTNSFGTDVTKVMIAEGNGFSVKEDGDGIWWLQWDGVTQIEENAKLILNYAVDGFVADGEDIAPQTIRIKTVKEIPVTKLSVTKLEFKQYPYETQTLAVKVKNNNYDNVVMFDTENDIEFISVPKGVDKEHTEIVFQYDNGILYVDPSANAVNGTYKVLVTPRVGTSGNFKSTSIELTIVVNGKKPVFALNATSISLDAAYPETATMSVKYLMDAGYELADLDVEVPAENLDEFINVTWDSFGTITFAVKKAGLSKAGTYKLIPTVKLSNGETVALKEVKVTVKVTNSSKATVSSKSKSITINPYVGEAAVKANLAVKGFTPQDSVDYTTVYEFVPTNTLARNAGLKFVVTENGAVQITGCEGKADGKYTYSLIGKIEGTDGTVTYTKPLAFTVQLKTKVLTVVPAKKSVTIYKDYCTTVTKNDVTYYKVVVPLSVKESADILLDTTIANSMANDGVITTSNAKELIVEIPVTLTKKCNLTLTPADSKFATFKVSISIDTKQPKAAFATSKLTMNRYTDYVAENVVVDTEGYVITRLECIEIKKGNKVIEEGTFIVNKDKGKLSISIPKEHDAEVLNGDYKITVTPFITINGEEKLLAPCTYTLKLVQPTVKLSVGEAKVASQVVNLYYKEIWEITSEQYTVNAYCGNEKLGIAELQIITNDKKIFTRGTINENRSISFEAVKDIETNDYRNGKNTYAVTAKVVKANGAVESKEVKLNKAFVVNVRELPKSITFAKTKLDFSPYMEGKVTTTVKSTELAALIETGNYYYDITAVEMNSKYKEAVTENGIVVVSGNRDGVITVDNIGLPNQNANYYYLVTVKLMHKNSLDAVATYDVKFSISVKNTLPKAILQMNSISLDNAFVRQKITDTVILTNGTGLWKLDTLTDVNIKVLNGKKDVTSDKYFNITYDENRFTVSINSRREDGTLMTVPKGTYKIEIVPTVSERVINGVKKKELSKIALNVKVTSSRPTVKLTSKVTISPGGEEQMITPTLKNNGKLIGITVICTAKPKDAKAGAIAITVLEDGKISIMAGADAVTGTYKFAIHPVTQMDGEDILLDTVNMSVVVKK